MLNVFKKTRMELGLTLKEAANIIGVHKQTIHRWEQIANVTKWNKKQYIYLFALKAKEQTRKMAAVTTGGRDHNKIVTTIDFMQIDLRDFFFNLANKKYDYV
jgi:DNA-binding XRE family transcriptional regulator